MVNNIAVDKNGELVDSFELKNPDKIYFTEFVKEQYGEVYLHPFFVPVPDILENK